MINRQNARVKVKTLKFPHVFEYHMQVRLALQGCIVGAGIFLRHVSTYLSS